MHHQWPPPRHRPDRLSDLSDDVLTHILSFAATKEAASTTALSRRWRRPLWLGTAAVNLDSGSRTTGTNALYFPHPDGRVIKKISIVLRDKEDIPAYDVSSAVEAGGVEEVRLEYQDGGCPDYTYATPSMSPTFYEVGLLLLYPTSPMSPSSYDVNISLDMLPLAATLRVLDLTGCKVSMYTPQDQEEDYMMYQPPHMSWSSWDLDEYYKPPPLSIFDTSNDLELEEHLWTPPYHPVRWGPSYHEMPRSHITLPWLQELRLRRCATSLDTLQTMMDAAHMLTVLRLESLSILQECGGQVVFRCLSVEALLMANLHTLHGTAIDGCQIKLCAPQLRRLQYIQSMCSDSDTSFAFESPTPHLERVHLATHSMALKLRSSVLAAVHHIRFLKLTSYSITDLDEDDMPVFPNLERLEIEELTCGSALNHGFAVCAVANLLRRCPTLQELRLKFSWRDYLRATISDPADQMAVAADFTPCRSSGSDGRGDGLLSFRPSGSDCRCEDSEFSCCGCRLACLKDSLRRVVVDFDTEELICFQVRLVKFLVENAKLLEEVAIHGGNGYDSSWIDRKIAKWRDDHDRHLVGEEEEKKVCFYCCMAVRLSSPPLPTTPAPIWPPSLLEFPPLETPPFSDEEVQDDDDDEEEEDIFPRHFIHSARKKKNGDLPCVKPKAKGSMTARRRGGASHHRHNRSL